MRRGLPRRDKAGERGQDAPTSPLRERARSAAEAMHRDNSARYFPTGEVLPMYSYLYDYYRARPEDTRLRRLAGDALGRLEQLAQRLEANAASPLPAEWAEARAALAEASQVFRIITEAW